MNIWFRTSNNNRNRLATSNVSSFNTSLPTITQDHRKVEDAEEEEESNINGRQIQHPHTHHPRDSEESSSILHKKGSIPQKYSNYGDKSKQSTDIEDDINKTNKSVRFNLDNQSLSRGRVNPQRSTSLVRTSSTYYGQQKNDEGQSQDQTENQEQFGEFKYIKNNLKPLVEQKKSNEPQLNTSSRTPPLLSNKHTMSRTPINSKQPSPSVSIIPKTGRSINSLSVNYLFTEERGGQSWNMQTNRSIEKSAIKTTGRKQNIKEHIISIIEYCSNEVGMAIYNTTNGEIFLCQIIERLTYFRTLSTLQRYYPLQIIYSSTLQHTPLMKKITQKFKTTTLRNFRRIIFDQTKGYNIYSQRGNKQESNPDNKFIAYSALNALIFYLQNSYQTKFNYSTLKMRWHLLEDLLVIESQTISSLQIFLNGETKQKQNCFINNFTCLTYGGTRMLRANFLQPLSNQKMIKNRQDLVQLFLDDKVLYDTICSQFVKFKNFEIITAKFIQTPKEKNIKSLKSYLSAIYSISHMCLLLKNFYKKIQPYTTKNLPIINKLFTLMNDMKITKLRQNIESNFDEQVLKNYEGGKTGKKDNFIFLFKMERIDDDFIEVMRITYSHTMEDILRIFKVIKDKSGLQLKLLYNEFRGYYIKSAKKINLSQLSQKVEDDIIQINQRKDCINFSTSMLVSLNNRLKESEKKLILLSQNLLLSIIQDIQRHIDILFDLNYEISLVDMIISFVSFIKKYNMVQFCRPIILNNSHQFVVQGLKTVWTNQSKYLVSNQTNLNMDDSKKIMIFEKQANSFQQLNTLYSIGYLTILSQIGCFVPAISFKTDIYHILLSKIHLTESIQNNLSHFQIQLYHFKNVLDNVAHKSDKSIILFDQLIKGTQYEQEVSLSLALINRLSKLSGKSFILISDIFLINAITKLQNSKPIMDKQIIKEEYEEDEQAELALNSIQVQKIQANNDLSSMMLNLNFSNQFVTLFNRLSLRNQKERLFR